MTRAELEREYFDQPVRGLQHMLRQLSRSYAFLPELADDGVFGERTLEAVMRLQRELQRPVTGVVDHETWEAIRRLWEETGRVKAHPRPLRAFPGEDFQVEPGQTHECMILPQVMFQLLGQYLEGIQPHVPNGHHGPESTANVRWLQKKAGLPVTGVMDQPTWDALSKLYELFITALVGKAERRPA